MLLALAIPCGIGAAIAYGTATAVQHDEAHAGTGQSSARGLVALLGNPRWLMSIGGDSIGLVLQVIALATGPVVLIQPLLVLSIVVALLVGWRLGGPSPGPAGAVAALAVLAGLGVFLVLVGNPGDGRPVAAGPVAWTELIALALTGGAVLAVRGRSAPVRAGVLGAVSGGLFGLVGVLINVLAQAYSDRGFNRLGDAAGWVPLLGLIVAGAIALTLTQVSFQIGELAASFPANESAAPVVAVLLGAVLLHEHLPFSAARVVAYLCGLAAVVLGTVRLARGHRPS